MNRFRNHLLTVAVLVILTGIGSLAPRAEADVPQIAKAFTAFWNTRDLNGAAALFADDVFYEDVTLGAVNHGMKEFLAFAQGYFSTAPADSRFDNVNAFGQEDAKGGHVTIEWVWTSTDTYWKTGKKFSVRGVSVIDLVGDKIVRTSDYWDGATVFRQIGLLPKGL
ncbi:MAG: nuclear transport factor 2 family protein [Fimbriimonas ginsengisoli]|nr:nuclear transport factor 2 family protein [Fimbriimonas ginsengisoli]